jgi:hypothetical protein
MWTLIRLIINVYNIIFFFLLFTIIYEFFNTPLIGVLLFLFFISIFLTNFIILYSYTILNWCI